MATTPTTANKKAAKPRVIISGDPAQLPPQGPKPAATQSSAPKKIVAHQPFKAKPSPAERANHALWCPGQPETGPVATRYIPTTTAPDSCSVPLAIIPAEGTSIGNAVRQLDEMQVLQLDLLQTLEHRLVNAGMLGQRCITAEPNVPFSESPFGQALVERVATAQRCTNHLHALLEALAF